MSSLHALCCFQSVKKRKHDFHFFCSMYNKTIIRFSFCDIQNNQGLSKGYQPQPSVLASTLIILDITKTSSNNCSNYAVCILPLVCSLHFTTDPQSAVHILHFLYMRMYKNLSFLILPFLLQESALFIVSDL